MYVDALLNGQTEMLQSWAYFSKDTDIITPVSVLRLLSEAWVKGGRAATLSTQGPDCLVQLGLGLSRLPSIDQNVQQQCRD